MYFKIIQAMKVYTDKLNIPAELFQWSAATCQWNIDDFPEAANIPNNYDQMASWYWRTCD
jgi:hypothetical protein